MKHLLSSLLLVLVVGCQSAEPDQFDGERGVPVEVTALDAAFVRFEERRIPVESFLLEMRRRVRDHWDEPEQRPWVNVHVAEGATGVEDGAWAGYLRRELEKAGVRYVTFH